MCLNAIIKYIAWRGSYKHINRSAKISMPAMARKKKKKKAPENMKAISLNRIYHIRKQLRSVIMKAWQKWLA